MYFGQYGTVLSVKQIMWEDTQRKRGYGYIEMEDGDQVRMDCFLRQFINLN